MAHRSRHKLKSADEMYITKHIFRFIVWTLMLSVFVFLISLAKADWAWVGGSQVTNYASSFQDLFVESPNNTPGSLTDTAYVANDSFVYVYGGYVRGPSLSNYLLRFNTRNQTWSALALPSAATSEFGMRGVFSPSVQPAAKAASAIFLDKSLNSLFIFGGFLDYEENDNTLFEFSFDSLMWRWLHGSDVVNDPGNFGEFRIESSSNVPPARSYTAYCYDQVTRQAYFYGGRASTIRAHADHWLYSVANNTWTWIHGSRLPNSPGVYGELGVGTSLTRPGARTSASFVYDETKRKMYFYGGAGTTESFTFGYPTDLWQYEPDRNVWTFLGGNRDSQIRSSNVTRGVTQEGAFPRSRFGSPMVIDQLGQKLYLFGGRNSYLNSENMLNDLWVLDLNSLLWTWIAGTDTLHARGRYGTRGVSSPLNNPPARAWSMLIFMNETQQLIVYGGYRTWNVLGDLWIYSILDAPQTESGSSTSTSTTEAAAINTASASTVAQRRPVVQPGASSSITGDLLGMFVGVPLLLIGICLIIFACVRSRNLKQIVHDKPALNISSYPEGSIMPISASNQISNTQDVTISPTTIGPSIPAHLQVNEVDFRFGKLLTSDNVYEFYHGEAVEEELIETCRFLCVKRLKIQHDLNTRIFTHEISVLNLLSFSQYVAKIIGFMLQPSVLLTKLYLDGSLFSVISTNALGRKMKLKFSLDIARGLFDIHNAQIVHYDLKPQSVMIDRDPKGKPFCVITDFEIARVLYDSSPIMTHSEAFSVRAPSVQYAAPEVIMYFKMKVDTEKKSAEFVKSADIYALALSIHFILCQKEPWNKK